MSEQTKKEYNMTKEELELSGAINRITMLACLYSDQQPTLARRIQDDVTIMSNIAVKYGELIHSKEGEDTD